MSDRGRGWAGFFAVAPVFIAFFGLAACTEPPPDGPSGMVAYGNPVPFLHRNAIRFSDFSMRYLGDKGNVDARQVALDADRSYLFEVSDGVERIRVEWRDTNNFKRYERFSVGGDLYFLRIQSSHPQNRDLNPGELVVWDFVQFQRNRPPVFEVATAKEASRLADRYRAYLEALQGGDWEWIQSFLSSNRNAALLRSGRLAHRSEREMVERLAVSASGVGRLAVQGMVHSPMEARLHLVSRSAEGGRIVGVLWVREAGEWRIERETTVPEDAAGARWIALFLARR